MLSDLRFRLRGLFNRHSMDAELAEELRFHLDRETEKYVSRGMSREDAIRQARIALGSELQIRDESHDARGVALIENCTQDLRYGIRMLARTPGETLVAILTLALGIGLNIAIYTVLDALMFKTLPVVEPDRIVQLRRANGDDSFTYALWQQIKTQQDVFSGTFAYQGKLFDSASGGEKHFVTGLYVSGEYFSTLGIHAMMGRTLTNQDDRRAAAPVAVISYPYWQRQFGRDPAILNRRVTLEKHSFQIVGVLPRDFYGVDVGKQFDVAIPLEGERIIDPERPILDRPMGWWLNVFGRLKPSISLGKARARMNVLSPQMIAAAMPQGADEEMRNWYQAAIGLFPAATGVSSLRENYGKPVILLGAMLVVVLLVACANVANLQLARFHTRQREFAIRAALGANRGRLLRQLIAENSMLSAAGVAFGLILAHYGSRLFVLATSSKQQPSMLDLSIDHRLVLFVVSITVFTTILFGIVPALQMAYVTPQQAMKQESHAISGGRRREWGRVLIPLQVGLSVVLLFASTLFVRSLDRLLGEKLGFTKEGVLLVNTDLETHRGTDQERLLLASDLQQRIQAIPGVLSVSRSIVTPISGMSWLWNVIPQVKGGNDSKQQVFVNLVSPGFFRTLDTSLIAGRDFSEHDTANSPRVAIVNETASAQMFTGANPIGRSFRDGDPVATSGKNDAEQNPLIQIVGIAGDAKYQHLRDPAPPTIYLPIPQNPTPFLMVGTYEIRFSGTAAEITRQVSEASKTVDPQISIEFELLSEQVNDSLRQQKMIAALASGLSTLALILACIGMYGVMSHSIARRIPEIGVRIALGARRLDVLQMVMTESMKLVGVGLVLGIPTALLSARFTKAMLFGVGPMDFLSLIVAIALIGATAALAAYRPAARAARIDPARALRRE